MILKTTTMQYNILPHTVTIFKKGGDFMKKRCDYMLLEIDIRKLLVVCAKLCIGTSEMAKLAKISTVTMQRICDNKPVRAKTVGKIAKALGVTPEELLAE